MDKKNLLQKIKTNFPKLKWKTVKNVSNGYDHIVLILDNKIVFRFPKNSYAKSRFKGEVGLLNFITNKVKPVLVPQYRYLSKDKSFGGYELIKGIPLSISVYKQLSNFSKRKLATDLGRFCSILHRIKPGLVSKYIFKNQTRTKEFKRLYGRYQKSFRSLFSEDDQNKFACFFSDLSKVLQEKHSKVFMHTDLFADNVYINKVGNLIGVIDFTDRVVDDPAVDFIRLWNYNDPGFVSMICERYDRAQASDIMRRSRIYFFADVIWNIFNSIEKNKEKERKWFYRKFKKFHYAPSPHQSSHQIFQ